MYLADHFSLLMKLIRNGEIDSALGKLREWYPQIVQVDCLMLQNDHFSFVVIFVFLYFFALDVDKILLVHAVNSAKFLLERIQTEIVLRSSHMF